MKKEEFLEYMKENHLGDSPVLRKLLSSEEKKLANILVKEAKLTKGISIEKGGGIIYYVDTHQNK